MVSIDALDGPGAPGELGVREPRQRRTREQWHRVLEAGVSLLEDTGYDGFTIAALCERAGVPPRALYARAATKDALFLAVYERGMARVLADQIFLDTTARSHELDDDLRIELAIRALVKIFVDHAAFLRAVVLISGAHPEVQRRGEEYRRVLRDLFTAALPGCAAEQRRDDGIAEREFCFSLVFSAIVVRTAYGEGFGVAGEAGAVANELVRMAQRYLLADSAP